MRAAAFGFVLGVALAAGVVRTQVGVPPAAAPPQRPAAVGTGLILGQVVDATDGRPVAGATVSISGGDVTPGPVSASAAQRFAAPTSVVADSQGRFVFASLPPGRFTLTASAPGYLAGASGQARPNGGVRPIALGPDQKLGGVVLALWKSAAITGIVTDDFGEPVVGAAVRAVARSAFGPASRLTPGPTTRTDDRGVYRLSGLTPGEYLVVLPSSTTTVPVSVVDQAESLRSTADSDAASRALLDILNVSGATPAGSSGIRVGNAYLRPSAQFGPVSTLALARDDGRVFVQPTVFFPGASTANGAAVLKLASGEERSNIDLQMNSVEGFQVSGTITGPDGPAANLSVRLLPADLDAYTSDTGLEVASTSTSMDGRFTLLAVPPGSYQLRALRVPRPTGPAPIINGVPQYRAPSEPTLFAQVPITVGGSGVSGLSVTLRIGPRLSGRVEFDGSAPRPAFAGARQVSVVLTPADGRTNSGVLPAFVNPDGQFTTMSVPPGKYFVSAGVPGWTLRSVDVGGRDAADVPVELDANDVSGAVLRFFDRPGQIAGVVHNARGEPDSGASVVLFPADYESWIENGASARRFRTTRTSADGRYLLANLLPGEYVLIAIGEETGETTSNRSALAQAAGPLAQRLSVGESSRQTQDLTTKQVQIR